MNRLSEVWCHLKASTWRETKLLITNETNDFLFSIFFSSYRLHGQKEIAQIWPHIFDISIKNEGAEVHPTFGMKTVFEMFLKKFMLFGFIIFPYNTQKTAAQF